MDAITRSSISFDGWKLLRDPLELFREGTRVRVQEQPLHILDMLLAQPGALVRREDLIARLWPRVVTDYEAGLHTAVRKLRAVLGDDAETPRYIETVPRQGYRFIGEVIREPDTPPASVARGTSRSWWWAGIGLALVALWAAVAVHQSAGRRDAARDLWLKGVLAWQTVGGGGSTPAEVDRVEDIFTRAIELNPELAEAHADRSRVRVGKFVVGYDTSERNVAAARADLARARELAGSQTFVLVREAQFAYLVEGDLKRGLRLLESAEKAGPLDGDQLMTKANFLAIAGRQEESLPVYRQAARLEPGSPAIYRFWMVNLFCAHRPAEALRVAREFDARMPGRLERGEWLFAYTGDTTRWRVEVDAANRFGKLPSGLSNEFELLRMEGNRDQLRLLVSSPEPARFQPHSAARSLIGAIQRPVAELRGWERLLADDASGAASAGRELEQFLRQQTVRPWNEWSLRLLEAEAALMTGDRQLARVRAARALEALPEHPNLAVHTYAHMMAARVLAWAGAHAQALTLLEQLATRFPGVGPATISRDPLLQAPLHDQPGWQALRARLEAQLAANRGLGS